jgi:hypothetical protein
MIVYLRRAELGGHFRTSLDTLLDTQESEDLIFINNALTWMLISIKITLTKTANLVVQGY